MIKSILLSVLALLGVTVFAQEKGEENEVSIHFAKHSFSQKLPFSEIQFVDSRFDTEKIGYFERKEKLYKLKPAEGLCKEMEVFVKASLKENLSPDAKQSAMVVVKQFWLREPSASEITKAQFTGSGKAFWMLMLKLEIYANQLERYTPLFRIDSTYPIEVFKKDKDIRLDVLEDCWDRLQKIDFEKVAAAKTKLKKASIDSFNLVRFQKPVLLSREYPHGVFLSFADFINKRVSYVEFEIQGGQQDSLYIFPNGRKELLANFWGYCDGNNYYIKHWSKFYPIRRSGYSFEFGYDFSYGYTNSGGRPSIGNPRSVSDVAAGVIAYGLANLFSSGTHRETKVYQVNMETGDVY